jgi:hypothetical protein
MKQLKEVLEYEVVALCRHRLSKGKDRFTLYLPPKCLPPFKVYKETRLVDDVVGVTYVIYTRPSPDGWLLKVKVRETEPFNPVLKKLRK